jgi:UDP-N-acetylglucosamine transferase subunit ALG13
MGIFKKNISKSSLWGKYILIFVCVGSREYQFDRLLKKLDELVEKKLIKDNIFAQIGKSYYLPKNYKYERFISVEKFKEYQKKAKLIISHGGTGALITSLKMGKQVLAVPRLARYGEHSDDHQLQVAGVLEKEGYLRCVSDIDELFEKIIHLKKNPINKRYNKPSEVINIIMDFIENNHSKK